MPLAVQAETLTLDRALDIAMERSSSVIRARNNLEINEEYLNDNEASLKSQFRFDVTPFEYIRSRTFDQKYLDWNTAESRTSSATFSVNQRIKWTDATLRLIDFAERRKSFSESAITPRTTSYSNELKLVLSQPLFTYNRTKQELEKLKLDYEQAQLSYEIKKLEIEYQVTREFYYVYYQRMNLEIAHEDYRNNEESFSIIKNKVDAGISAQEELLQAEINLANSRANLENSQVSYESTLDNLKVLLGLTVSAEIDVSAEVQKTVVEIDLDKAVASGLKYRMELRQRDIAIQNARYDLIVDGSEDEFKASVDLEYGVIGTDETFRDIYENPERSQSVSVQLNIPIWDWGKKKSKMRAGNLQIANQILSSEDEEKNIILGIRQAYRALQNQLTQIEIAEKNVENAQLTYEINLERYKNGDISSKIIGEYQTQLSEQQLNHVRALIDYRLELLNLRNASLWDFENNRPVLDID